MALSWLLAAAACGYTYNLKSKFVESAAWNQMLKPGKFDSGMLARLSAPNQLKLQCDPSDGAIIVGNQLARVSKGKQNPDHPTRWDIPKILGDGSAIIFYDGGVVSAMCARWNVDWKYTTLPPAGAPYDTFALGSNVDQTVDVAVIGFGAGGAAAASAIRLQDASVTIAAIHTSASTTALSTGVVWFPNRSVHTAQRLKEATGGDKADFEELEAYIETGAESLAFWRQHLELGKYNGSDNLKLAYDYTTYADAPKDVRGNSWQLKKCTDVPPCGETLQKQLRKLAEPYDDIMERATQIQQLVDGAYVVTTGSNRKILAASVVVATGGKGALGLEGEKARLALARTNNGFSDKVRDQLGLSNASAEVHRYHLEFAKGRDPVTGKIGISERWFAVDNCVPNPQVDAYSLCQDYSTRAQKLGAFGAEHDVSQGQAGDYTCEAGTSGEYWKEAMKRYIGDGFPLQCSLTKLYAGMIDTKTGFATKLYQSTESPGLFAAGTTGAAFTGDAYFGPGSTLGLGLTSGYAIAPQAVAHVKAYRASLGKDKGYGARRKKPWPALFIAGGWVLLVGILAHLASNVAPKDSFANLRLRQAHYALMTVGTIFITVAFAAVHKTSAMSDFSDGRAHSRIGVATFVSLWAQVGLGIVAQQIHSNKPWRVWFGVAHRLHGLSLLVLVAYLYWSGSHSTMFKERYQWAKLRETKESAYGYTAAAAAFTLAGLYFARKRIQQDGPREQTLQELAMSMRTKSLL